MPVNLTAVNVGAAPDDETGDIGRNAFIIVNNNFALVAGALIDAEIKAFVVGCTAKDEDLIVGNDVEYFRMPYGFVLLDARASVFVAPTDDDIILDIKMDGYTILNSTGLVIPDGSETSYGFGPPPVDPYTILTEDSLITYDVLQIGSTIPGQWLKITFIGYTIFTSY